MKLKCLFVLSFFFALSCTVTEKPEFIKVKDVKIISANTKEIIIQTDLLFYNKNNVGGNIETKNINVLLDSIKVATMKTSLFKIPKESEFVVPLTTNIPYDKIFNDNKKNILGNLLNILTSKKMKVQFKGDVSYKLGAFNYDYPLDYSEEISFKIK